MNNIRDKGIMWKESPYNPGAMNTNPWRWLLRLLEVRPVLEQYMVIIDIGQKINEQKSSTKFG